MRKGRNLVMDTAHKASAIPSLTDCFTIQWKEIERYVRKLRQRIFRAKHQNQSRRVRKLQRLILRSKANLLLSIKRVTQINRGKRTAGIDGERILTPRSRMALFQKMSHQNISSHLLSFLSRFPRTPLQTVRTPLRVYGFPFINLTSHCVSHGAFLMEHYLYHTIHIFQLKGVQ